MLKAPLLLVGKTLLTVTRKNQGSYNSVGEWEEDTNETEIKFYANIQPAGYADVRFLPDTHRTRKALNVYTRCELRSEKEGIGGWDGDVFTWEGDTYKVMKVERYNMGILNHFHVVAVREELTQ